MVEDLLDILDMLLKREKELENICRILHPDVEEPTRPSFLDDPSYKLEQLIFQEIGGTEELWIKLINGDDYFYKYHEGGNN